MQTTAGLAVIALSALACGSSRPTASHGQPSNNATDPAAKPTTETRATVTTWLEQAWDIYERHDIAGYANGVHPDVYQMPSSSSKIVGSEAAIATTRLDFAAFAKAKAKGISIQYIDAGTNVGLSSDSKLAWALLHKEVMVTLGDEARYVPVTISTVLIYDSGDWKKLVSHTSANIPMGHVMSIVKSGKAPQLPSLNEATEPAAQPVAEQLRRMVTTPATWATFVADGEETQLVFANMGIQALGGKRAVQALMKLSASYPDISVTGTYARLLRPDTAFAVANIEASVGEHKVPFRATTVFRRIADKWRVIQSHVSFAHAEEQSPLIQSAERLPCNTEAPSASPASGAPTPSTDGPTSEASRRVIRFRNLLRKPIRLSVHEGGKQLAVLGDFVHGQEGLFQLQPAQRLRVAAADGSCIAVFAPRANPSAAVVH